MPTLVTGGLVAGPLVTGGLVGSGVAEPPPADIQAAIIDAMGDDPAVAALVGDRRFAGAATRQGVGYPYVVIVNVASREELNARGDSIEEVYYDVNVWADDGDEAVAACEAIRAMLRGWTAETGTGWVKGAVPTYHREWVAESSGPRGRVFVHHHVRTYKFLVTRTGGA